MAITADHREPPKETWKQRPGNSARIVVARSILISFALFAAWLVVGVASYQESPDDTPMIVSLFEK